MTIDEQAPGVRRTVCTEPGLRLSALLCALVCVFGVSACGSKPMRSGGDATHAPGDATVAATRGGGYYLDDGPGERVPADLDAIPDAVPQIEPLHPPALRPYTVMGQTFVPRTDLAPYRERGHASWYGRRFHGKPTSIGERYDMFAMSAAHPTLPIPSYARVTNLANGRTVVVRVNDRGPFLRGRLIDLSYAAAHRLGYINSGSAEVEVESILPDEIRLAQTSTGASSQPVTQASDSVVPEPVAIVALPPLPVQTPVPVPVASTPAHPQPAEVPPSVVAAPGGAFVQLGAFATSANAAELADRVKRELGLFAERLHLIAEEGHYRLQLGPFVSADEARLEAGRIGALLDLQPFVITR